MIYRYSILSKKERNKIIESLICDNNLIVDFTLTTEELYKIKRFDRPHVSLGYSLQYLFLKNRGISILSLNDKIPTTIINYVAEQLKCTSIHLHKYWIIKNTKQRHFKEIYEMLNLSKFELDINTKMSISNIIWSTSDNFKIAQKFIKYMRENNIIPPNISTVEEVLSKEISIINMNIYKLIYDQIDDISKLDKLFNLEENGISCFSRIQTTSVNVSSSGVKELLKLIKEIDSYGTLIDISFLHEDKIKYFNTKIQRCNKFKIEQFKDNNKRYSYLSLFLYFKKKEFMDMVIEVTSTHAHMIQKRSKKKNYEYKVKNQLMDKSNSDRLKVVIKDILKLSDSEELEEYKSSLRLLEKELDLQKDSLDDIDFLLKSYQSIDYINELLEVIEFDSNVKPELVRFINTFKSQCAKKNNKVDISFFDTKWQRNIKKYDYSKKVLSMAITYTIRDGIRSGDLFVRESKKYNSFDYYLIDSVNDLTSTKAIAFLDHLKGTIEIPHKFDMSKDIEQDEKSAFSKKIYSYLPKISMPEVLYDVNKWTNFLEDFNGYNKEKLEQEKILVAALLADGHNLGFSKMSIASDIEEFTLRKTSEYYLNYENLSNAQKTLVNYHHSLEIVKNWGDGKNSSSDGMRVPINSKTIYADYNAHYGNKGGGIYRHVSDQYTPYYVQILEGRDSKHVLDGLLYHDTDLDIYDH